MVCLSVNKITQKVIDECLLDFCEGRRNNLLDFGSDMHSDLDPGTGP